MKNSFLRLLLLLLVIHAEMNLKGQELKYTKYEKQSDVFYIGKETWIKIISIKDAMAKERKLDPSNIFQFNINGIDLTDIRYNFFNDSSMLVKLKVPLIKELIGKEKMLQLEDITKKRIYTAKVNIVAQKPIIIPDINNVLAIGEDYKRIIIKGENLTSVTEIRINDRNVVLFPTETCDVFDDGKSMTIQIKALEDCKEKERINISYTYDDGTSSNKDSIDLLLRIYKKDRDKNINIQPNYVFLDDLKRLKSINFELLFQDNFYNSTDDYRIISFGSDKIIPHEKVNDRIIIALGAGDIKHDTYFTIKNIKTGKSKEFSIKAIDKPIISSISGGIHNALQFNPYNNIKIIIKGENLEKVRFFIADSDENYIKKVYQNDKRCNDFYKEINIELDKDKIPFVNLKYGFTRESFDNKEIIYDDFNGVISIVTPKKVFNLNNFMFFETDDSSEVRLNERNLLSTENKLYIKAIDKKIPSFKGSQGITIKATLYDSEGILIETKDYQNKRLGTNYFLTNTDNREYYKTNPDEYWNIYKEFDEKIKPWNKIKVEIAHNPSYYSETNEIPDYQVQEILIKGKWHDNFNTTITMPQTLFVFGQRDTWKAEVLPVNIGYGIEYQPRNTKTGKKWPLSFGTYISGLNFLDFEKQDSTSISQIVDTTNNSAVTTKIISDNSKRIIDKGSLSVLFLVQIYVFNKEKKMKLPIQIGTGITLPFNDKRLQWFGAIGFGVTYEF